MATRNRRIVFAFHYQPGSTSREAALLTASFRRFAGEFAQFPLLAVAVLPTNAMDIPREPWQTDVTLLPFPLPEDLPPLPLAFKPFAAAFTESQLQHQADLLVWMDADTLFFNPPTLLDLAPGKRVAVPPVHKTLISALANKPLNSFWRTVYAQCGANLSELPTVVSLADQQRVFAHFNAGLISVRPELHLLSHWEANFRRLCMDEEITQYYGQDPLYRIFIHQAALAGTIVSSVPREKIELLPNDYNYPLHLQTEIPCTTVIQKLNHLTTARYEDFDPPFWFTEISSEEPVKGWLEEMKEK